MQKWTLLISIALIFAGCADLKKSEQKARILAMEEQLDSWEKELSTFNRGEWKMWMRDTDSTVEILKQLESDTIPLEVALKIDDYRNIQKQIPGLADLHDNLQGDIEAALWRLKKLKKDIEKGNGKRNKYDTFLSNEEQELELIAEKFTFYKSTFEFVKNKLPNAQKEIEAIIAERILTEEVQ